MGHKKYKSASFILSFQKHLKLPVQCTIYASPIVFQLIVSKKVSLSTTSGVCEPFVKGNFPLFGLYGAVRQAIRPHNTHPAFLSSKTIWTRPFSVGLLFMLAIVSSLIILSMMQVIILPAFLQSMEAARDNCHLS